MISNDLIKAIENAIDFYFWYSIHIDTTIEQKQEAYDEIERLTKLLKKYKEGK